MLVRLPQPYDFELSTARFDVYGRDRATLWLDGGIHRFFAGREVRIEAAPAVSTSPRTTRRSRRRCSTSSGCRSISTPSMPGRRGTRRSAARGRARRLPPAVAGRPVRGAGYLGHGAAGLAPVGGCDQEPVHRALRRGRPARARLPGARAGGARDRGRADRRRLLDPQSGVRRRARPQRPRPRSARIVARRGGRRQARRVARPGGNGRPTGSSPATWRGRMPGPPATWDCGRRSPRSMVMSPTFVPSGPSSTRSRT